MSTWPDGFAMKSATFRRRSSAEPELFAAQAPPGSHIRWNVPPVFFSLSGSRQVFPLVITRNLLPKKGVKMMHNHIATSLLFKIVQSRHFYPACSGYRGKCFSYGRFFPEFRRNGGSKP
jgi:hypothetical protein